MLEVAVKSDHSVTTRVVDAGGQGHLMTEVPRKRQELDSTVLQRVFLYRAQSTVGRAIVDEYDFIIVFRHDFGKSGDQFTDALLFVEQRYHDREMWPFGTGSLVRYCLLCHLPLLIEPPDAASLGTEMEEVYRA